jgi:hypothetical protein
LRPSTGPARAVSAASAMMSSTVKDLVAGSGLEFENRGEHQLKGIADPWRVFGVR